MKTSISSIDNANTGARGDCIYLPVNSNKPIFNSTDDKNASLNFEYTTDHCCRSNFASGEPEENQVCFPTSSATFIVSSSPPSEITIEQNEHSIHNIIPSSTNIESLTSPKECNDHHQRHLWFKKHSWISMTIITGIIMIFIIIIVTIIIIH